MDLANPDFDQIYDLLLRYTKKFQKELDFPFIPHGAVMTWDGKVRWVGVTTEKREKGITRQAALERLINELRAMAASGKFRATGGAVDFLLKTPPRKANTGKDAIGIVLEHKDGLCQVVYTPYERSQTGSFTFYEPFVLPQKPHIFPKQM